jgi:hypothetical protein
VYGGRQPLGIPGVVGRILCNDCATTLRGDLKQHFTLPVKAVVSMGRCNTKVEPT